MRKHIEKVERYRMSNDAGFEFRFEKSMLDVGGSMPDAFTSAIVMITIFSSTLLL